MKPSTCSLFVVHCVLASCTLLPTEASAPNSNGSTGMITPCEKSEWTESRKTVERHVREGAARPISEVDGGSLAAKASLYLAARMRKDVDAVLTLMPALSPPEAQRISRVYADAFAEESIARQTTTFADVGASNSSNDDELVVLTIVVRVAKRRCYEDVVMSRWRKVANEWRLLPDLPSFIP